MEYKILRGTDKIGGTITEITTDSGTRIWVDFGCELSAYDEHISDAKMIKLMRDKKTRPDAVFFTHIHGDHIGLLSHIPNDVVIFIGSMGKRLLENIRTTLTSVKNFPKKEKEKLTRELDILSGGQVRFYDDFENNEGKFKDISFKALGVDNSVPDAYMLRFEADGKVFVHTGDFRSHGRLGKTLISDIKNHLTDKKVDVLFTEGTMMSRRGEKVFTENEMEKKATELFEKHPYVFLICSSLNMESLGSFYGAAVKSTNKDKKKALYCSFYEKSQLDVYREYIGRPYDIWELKFWRSYPIEESLNKELKNNRTQYEHMLEEGFVMLVHPTDYYQSLMERFRDKNPLVVYSMWHGYLEPGKEYSRPDLIKLKNSWKDNFIELHTSGHADKETIAEVIKTINPQEAIVPIHTENPDGFKSLDLPEELKGKIVN